jgi:S1-C subfamily serine protease
MRVLLTLVALAALASPTAAQVRVDTTRKVPPAPPAATTGYGAWFGSVPDMDNSFGGILLSGVSDGSPAQKAGLKAGDTIMKMGGTDTPDLQAMVTVLRAKRPGDTLEVVFVRDGKQQKVPVVLSVRPGS